MEIITILLAIITAILLTPFIIKFVKLTKTKVSNYDADIEECYHIGKDNKVKIDVLEKTIQDLIILQGKETERNGLNNDKEDKLAKDVYEFILDAKEEQDKMMEITDVMMERHTILTKRLDAVADDVYNAIFMGTEFVRDKLTPKSTKDASFDNYCETTKGTLEDKDMFQPLEKFKNQKREYEPTPFEKPTREDVESKMPVKWQNRGYKKGGGQERSLNARRKTAKYKKEFRRIYGKLYGQRYYQYKKHFGNHFKHTTLNKNK